MRVVVRALIALSAVILVVGCECGGPTPLEASALYPMQPGDRWRERVGDVGVTRGVTSRSESGLALVFGQLDARPTYYRANAEEVALVTPEGEALDVLIRGPVRAGTEWEHRGADGVRCESRITEVDVERRVAGVTLERCAVIRQRCEHPAGAPFPVATSRTTTRTFCPGVGPVETRTELEPPPPDTVGPPLASELVSWNVAGAPAPAVEREACDVFALLPADVQAACPGFRYANEDPGPTSCTHRFAAGGGRQLQVRMARLPDEAAARQTATSLADAPADAERRETPAGEFVKHGEDWTLTLQEGRHVLVVRGQCEPEQAARLAETLRSLVR